MLRPCSPRRLGGLECLVLACSNHKRGPRYLRPLQPVASYLVQVSVCLVLGIPS